MGTLRQYRRRVAVSPIDLRGVPLPTVVARYWQTREYLTKTSGALVRPEHEALDFYLQNAAYALATQRVHPDAQLGELEPLVEQYHATVRDKSLRLFYYLLLICTRESRHVAHNVSLFAELAKEYPLVCGSFTKSLSSLGSDGAVTRLLDTPPDVPLGMYTSYLFDVFDKGADLSCFQTGYGGKAWANVARVLRDFVRGDLTAELMLDQGFALAHNNGPIFNKQMLYHNYDAQELLKILDVQRAGMIPQLVATCACPYVLPRHEDYRVAAADIFGAEFGGSIDWDKVEALGSVQKYAKHKLKAHAPVKKPAPGAGQLATALSKVGTGVVFTKRTA